MDAIAIIADMVKEAEKHADDLSKDRIRAVEYYMGVMKDTPSDVGRSQMVKRTVRAQIKKVLPSMMRTIFASDKIVEFQPVGPQDDAGAEQATDYMNLVVVPEADVRKAAESAIHDALLLRNGIIKWWWDEKTVVSTSSHSGLMDDAFAQLVADDGVEVLEHTERVEQVMPPGGMAAEQVVVHDCKIKRTTVKGKTCAAAVPRERFLIHPDATSLEDSILTGDKTPLTRSDLIAMGYDADLINGLPLATDEDDESDTRRDFIDDGDEAHRANQPVDYYDIYVRFDKDGDGIAELRHMCFAGGLGERNLLMDEECDEVQFCDVKVMAQPHQWEGTSLADDLMDLQRAETVLMRQTLDNIYWTNNPQPTVQEGAVINMDAVLNPEFGKPIRVKMGTDARAAVNYNPVPFVANQSFAMLEYLDKEASDRTGVSDMSSGLPPDALQNVTAKASAMIEQAGIGQTEMMVRTVADGLRRLFLGLLRLTIRHQDVPKMVRLRDEWVEFDPRHWNAEMDCSVNTGLGAGTRERDMMMMSQVMAAQEKLLAGFGPDNPFVKPENVWAATSKMIEAAGLKPPELYFTEPDPQEVQQKLEAMRNQPDPETVKAQARMQELQMKAQVDAQMKQMEIQAQAQLDQQKMKLDMEAEAARMQVARDKEMAQMQADLQVKEAERQAELEKQARDMEFKREELNAKMRLEYVKLGLTTNDEGDPIQQSVADMQAMMAQVQNMLAATQAFAAAGNRAKRVVRDENGDIVGVVPVERMN